MKDEQRMSLDDVLSSIKRIIRDKGDNRDKKNKHRTETIPDPKDVQPSDTDVRTFSDEPHALENHANNPQDMSLSETFQDKENDAHNAAVMEAKTKNVPHHDAHDLPSASASERENVVEPHEKGLFSLKEALDKRKEAATMLTAENPYPSYLEEAQEAGFEALVERVLGRRLDDILEQQDKESLAALIERAIERRIDTILSSYSKKRE